MPKKRLTIIAKENNLELEYLSGLVESKLPSDTVTGVGKGRWINEEGQAMLEKAIDIPELTPKILRGIVHSKAPNKSYLYVYIKEIQKKVPVVIPRKLVDHLLAGKNVNVEVITDNVGTSYRYVK